MQLVHDLPINLHSNNHHFNSRCYQGNKTKNPRWPPMAAILDFPFLKVCLTLFRLGFLRVAQLGGGGGGGRKVPAAYNSKTINDIEANNLVWFNWRMTSSLRHNDVITVIDVSEFKKRQINGTK